MNYDYIVLSAGFVIFAIALGLIIYYGTKDDGPTTNSGGGGGDTNNNDFWVALLNSSTAVTGVSSTYYSDSVTLSSTCWKAGTGLSFNYADGGNYISGFDTAFGSSSDGTSLWVAVGQATPSANSSIIWSNNGQSWQESTGLSSGTISATKTVESRGVAYGLSSDKGTSLWVAVGGKDSNNSGMLFSLNGQSWQNCTGLSFIGINLPDGGYTVAYGLSSDKLTPIWVAGGFQGGTENNPTLLFSLDGQSWQNSSGASFHHSGEGKGKDAICRSVAYGLSSDRETGIWCATGYRVTGDTLTTLFSLDGQSWQNSTGQQFKTVAPTPPDTSGGHAVAYGLSTNGNGIWVATGVGATGANNILYSDDGQSWRNASGVSFAGNGGRSVRFGTSSNGTSLWMAGGSNGGTDETAILVSLDGVLWNEVSTPMTTNNNVKVEGLAYSKVLGPLSGNIQGLNNI